MSTTEHLTSVISKKFNKLVGEIPTNCLDWLHAIGKASEALLYSILFMPELKIVNDSVLLAWGMQDDESQQRFLDSVKSNNMSLQQLEASFNFIEVGYIFDTVGRDTSDEEDELLANLICNAWEGWLKTSFPDRKFIVEVLSAEETGSTVGVHFFESR